MASLSGIPTLADVSSWASAEEISILEMLVREDQAHLFAKWVPGADVAQKHAFCAQVCLSRSPC